MILRLAASTVPLSGIDLDLSMDSELPSSILESKADIFSNSVIYLFFKETRNVPFALLIGVLQEPTVSFGVSFVWFERFGSTQK